MGLTSNYTLQKKRLENLKTEGGGKKKKTIQKWKHKEKKNEDRTSVT